MFVGLILGGLLAPINWRLVFLISVPVGLFATVWAYLKLVRSAASRNAPRSTGGAMSPSRSGWSLVMVGVTYGIRPYKRARDRLGLTRA